MSDNLSNTSKSQSEISRSCGRITSGQCESQVNSFAFEDTQDRESLPCLNSNNCTEFSQNPLNLLSPYHRKQALIQAENTERFINYIGINRVGFLTLTFVDNVTDYKEASKRFGSLRAHFFHFFGHWILVKEKQKRGAWHYHLLIDTLQDIRTGFNWELYIESITLRKKGKPYRHIERAAFRSASPALKSIWKELRENLYLYNFGRSELLPIRTNAEGTAKYIGKYVSKHVSKRIDSDKGARLFSASQGQLLSNTKFSWNTEGGKEWRRKLKMFCEEVLQVPDTDHLKERFGKRWAYHLADDIYNVNHYIKGKGND